MSTEPANAPSVAAQALSEARQRRIVGLLGVAAAVAVVAFLLLPKLFRSDGPTAAKAPAPNTFPVSDAEKAGFTIAPAVTHAFHDALHTDGKIVANADATTAVYSPYSGRVTRLVASIGDRVRRGAPLLTIEASEYAQALADLASSGAQRQLTHTIEQRRHAAYDAQGASLQDWQQAQADAAAAEAAYATARNHLRIFGRSDADIDMLEKGGARDAAASVVAPIDGVVTDRAVGPGQVIAAGGSTPVYTIADLTSVWVVANVRETDAAALHVGEAVDIHVLAIPGRTFSAQLAHVASAVDPATRRIAVRAVLPNPSGVLRPEMFASVDIATGEATSAVAVPEEAVVREGDAARVWVARGNLVELRPVQIGRSDAGLLEIRSGLVPGERVVTAGSLFIDRAARAE